MNIEHLLRPAEPGERFHPHTIPLYLVDRLVQVYRPTVFVETGTYLGFTPEAVVDKFERVFTIEVDEKLAEAARWKFAADERIKVVNADSRRALAQTLADDAVAHHPALIWLDAHWSGGVTGGHDGDIHTAVRAELEAIQQSGRQQDIIMVDDTDDFDGQHGYPTAAELADELLKINPNYEIASLPIRRGVVVALPPRGQTAQHPSDPSGEGEARKGPRPFCSSHEEQLMGNPTACICPFPRVACPNCDNECPACFAGVTSHATSPVEKGPKP